MRRWKRHYGLRQVGNTLDRQKVISGLDVFKFTSSVGQDLELLLTFLSQENCTVDWLGYARAATIEGWPVTTILKKLSYPITEVFGERYWLECKYRLMVLGAELT